MREASSLVLGGRLLAEGAIVTAYDPVVDGAEDRLRGVEMADSVEGAIRDADAAVLVTEWPAILHADWEGIHAAMRTPLLIDGRNALDPALMGRLGYVYEGVGRVAD